MLTVTPAAVEEFKAFLSQVDKEDSYIRIFINGMGWGGPNFALALEESVQGQDHLEEKDGISFIYENQISSHLNDVIIDFHLAPQRGFSIRKQGQDSSGCGSCSSCDWWHFFM